MNYYVQNKLKEAKRNYDLFVQNKDYNYLKELAKIFSIELDESRLSDYSITKYLFEANRNFLPTLSIYDKKEKTSFTSEFTSDADLANIFGDEIHYASVISNSKLGTISRNFYIGDATPIAEKLEIINGNNNIIFEKRNLEEIFDRTDYDFEARVSYNEFRKSNDDELVNDLIFKNIYFSKKVEDGLCFFSRKNGSEFMARHKHFTCPDNYICYENGNVIYRIKIFQYKDMEHECDGVFIDRLNELQEDERRLNEVLSCEFYIKSHSMLLDSKCLSALLYKDYDREHKVIEQFEIYKTNDKFIIKYITKYWNPVTYWEENITEHEYPIRSNGPIMSDEIRYLVTRLQTMYNSITNYTFYNELLKYADMIENKDNLLEETKDLLSPKRLINTPFEQILEEIGNNKDKYFDLAQKEFEEMAYGEVKKPIIKALKPSNN